GIMKCDLIAQGIIDAVKTVKPKVPMVVRLEGTRVQEARKLLADSKLPVVSAATMNEAAEKIVQAVKS
ncbi:MAG: succinate--CoA ligase subunit beta, partial [Candidatus Omnitrophica bacterium]|nr:succinate--CoA ligase subunit beta [Candidatus Omnitrophota bacterium]